MRLSAAYISDVWAYDAFPWAKSHRLITPGVSAALACCGVSGCCVCPGLRRRDEDRYGGRHYRVPSRPMWNYPVEPLGERGRLDLMTEPGGRTGLCPPRAAPGRRINTASQWPDDAQVPKSTRRCSTKKASLPHPVSGLEVSALQFKPDRIVLDFNGGPFARHRFLSHIETERHAQMAPQGPPATGCRIIADLRGRRPGRNGGRGKGAARSSCGLQSEVERQKPMPTRCLPRSKDADRRARDPCGHGPADGPGFAGRAAAASIASMARGDDGGPMYQKSGSTGNRPRPRSSCAFIMASR